MESSHSLLHLQYSLLLLGDIADGVDLPVASIQSTVIATEQHCVLSLCESLGLWMLLPFCWYGRPCQ